MVRWFAMLLCVPCALAQSFTDADPAWGSIATSAVCTSPDWGDILDCGFEAADNYGGLFTEGGTTANIDDAYSIASLTTGYTTNFLCSRGWNIVVPSDGTETYAVRDNGSAIDLDTTPLTVTFWLYVHSALDNNENFRIFYVSASSPSSGIAVLITLQRTAGGALQLQATGSSSATAVAINTAEWYKVNISLATATTGNASTFQVNDGTAFGFNRAANDARYFSFGAVANLDAGDDATLTFDLVSIDTP